MSKQQLPDFTSYRTSRSTRPRWATALIVAVVLFVAGIVYAVIGGVGWIIGLFGLATVIALAIAGISALARK